MGREYTGDPGQYLIDPQLSQGHHNTYNNFFFLSAYLIIRKEGPLIQGVEKFGLVRTDQRKLPLDYHGDHKEHYQSTTPTNEPS